MDVKDVERHHLLFYISTIFCIFITKLVFFDFFGINYLEIEMGIIEGIFYLLAIYFIGSFIIVKGILFGVYGFLSNHFLNEKYETKNHLGSGDFYLATTSIITAFIIDDFLKIVKNPIIALSLIGFLFCIVYWLNQKVKVGLF